LKTTAKPSKTFRLPGCSDKKPAAWQVFLCPTLWLYPLSLRSQTQVFFLLKLRFILVACGVKVAFAGLCRYYVRLHAKENAMSQSLTAEDELVSDVVACQLVIKQILDVIDVIAPVEVRDKMASQLKSIDFAGHPSADPVTLRAIQKAVALIELRFTPQSEAH